MTSKEKVPVQVTNGPSREDLRDQFRKERTDLKLTVSVNEFLFKKIEKVAKLDLSTPGFQYEKAELSVNINGLEWEDGSGQSWGIKGYVLSVRGDEPLSVPFSGYYHSGRRTGRIEISI